MDLSGERLYLVRLSKRQLPGLEIQVQSVAGLVK